MSLKNLKSFHPLLRALSVVAGITFVAYCVTYSPEQLGWTGFKKDTEESRTQKIIENGKEITVTTKYVSGKTLWDWLSVLGVPLSLAVLGFLFQQRQQELAESIQKEEALQVYFDRLATLLIDKNLISIATKVEESANATKEEQELLSASTDVIRARTLSILRRLEGDGKRKGSVVQFLTEAEFVSKLKLDLSGANLSNADLSNADLSSANLSNADLSNAKLIKANLRSASLVGANLSNANLRNAVLIKANLVGANLSNADLTSAYLSSADLRAADLDSADLSNANFTGATFGINNFSGANLRNAVLIETNLAAASNLRLEQVAKAELCRTKLPPSMQIDPNRDCKKFDNPKKMDFSKYEECSHEVENN